MNKTVISLAIAAAMLAQPARAADFDIVEKGGAAIVSISGKIATGDARVFEALTRDRTTVVVRLDGPGGLLAPALAIGATIRTKGYATAVAGRDVCASACGFIWLAGSTRFLSDEAVIGLHAAYSTAEDGTRSESGVGNARIGAYLTMLGLPLKVVDFATTPGPETIARITRAKALELGIETRDLDDPSSAKGNQPPDAIGQETDPSTYERAARNFDASYRKSGMAGVNAAIRQCYERARELRTVASAAYCVALDSIATTMDIAANPDGLRRDAANPFNRIQPFRKRSAEAAAAASASPESARAWGKGGSEAFGRRINPGR